MEVLEGESTVDQARRLACALVGKEGDLVAGIGDLCALMADFREVETAECRDVC
jgi:hypothetical protein